MPAGLDKLKKKIWDNLKGKISPRTKKLYTESEAWAIATARWNALGKSLSVFSDEKQTVSESEMLYNAIEEMESK